MSNWISFSGYPPIEMLLRPCTGDPSIPFSLSPEDHFVDFIGGGQSLAPSDPSSGAVADGNDSASSMTIHGEPSCQIPVGIPFEADDSTSVEASKAVVNGQSPESVCRQTPLTEETVLGAGKAVPVTTAMTVVGSTQRSSVYRGVTRHRWTGRYEAHLWDNTCRREGQKRKGRQVYLGGFDKEEKAARAYDLAALKYWGVSATTNFPADSYSQEMEIMQNMSKQEFIASIRRNSSGFSRGASIYRGVTRHHQQGRWQARIGRVTGNKDLYLGTFTTEEEAAEAYDVAAIKFRGPNAITNFALARYDVEVIANRELPIGTSSTKRSKKAVRSGNSDLSVAETTTKEEHYIDEASTKQTKQALELAVTSADTISSFDLCRYNSEAITNGELPLGSTSKWMEELYQPNTRQLTLTGPAISEHQSSDPYASFQNFFQVQSSTTEPSVSLAYYGAGDASFDLGGQSFYLPLLNGNHSSQVHCGQPSQGSEALQLTF